MNFQGALWEDFVVFAKAHVESGDIDPTYPVLKNAFEAAQLPLEIRLWRTLLYVTWYDLGSAERAWNLWPEPGRIGEDRLPTGTERRGFRGNGLAKVHVDAAVEWSRRQGGSLEGWVQRLAAPGGELGWAQVRAGFQQLPWAGPWASYKWADLMKQTIGLPITANDLGIGGGGKQAGPIPGMERLTGVDWRRCATDHSLQRALYGAARSAGVPYNGLDQLETSLCDFNSLCKGAYYVGHDIDQQQHHMLRGECSTALWSARMKAFELGRLGELSGWVGVRKHLNKVYLDKQVVLQ